MPQVSEASGYKTVSNGAFFVISDTGETLQNINASVWDVTSCRPVHVYRAAASLNPTYTDIFSQKSSTSKSSAQNGEK